MTYCRIFLPVSLFAIVTIASFVPLPAFAQEEPTPQTGLDCLTGTPDGSFNGDRPLTRNEFAAGLNDCLLQLEQQLDLEDYATRSEVEATIQSQQELNTELETLSDRLNTLSGDSP
jgi:hypothetical protein